MTKMEKFRRWLRKWLQVPLQAFPPYDTVCAVVNYEDMGLIIFTKNGKIYRYDVRQDILMRMTLEIPQWP